MKGSFGRRVRVAGIVLGCLVLLVAGALAFIQSQQPTGFRFSRKRAMQVDGAALRACVEDVRELDGWLVHFAAPHDQPKVTLSAVTSGTGAWVERADSLTVGRMTLTELTETSAQYELVTTGRLGSTTSTGEVRWTAGRASLEVEYAISASLSGVPRLLWPVADLERRAGPDLERSLSQLEACAARHAKP
jgi:hypothetical protein